MASRILVSIVIFVYELFYNYAPVEAIQTINLRGSRLTPVYTTFYQNGSVDLGAIPNYAKFMSRNNFSAIWLFSAAGEPFSTNLQERKSILKVWLDVNRKNRYGFLIFVGVGYMTTMDSCNLAAYGQQVKANGIVYKPIADAGAMTPAQAASDLSYVAKCAPNTAFMYHYDAASIYCNRNPNVGLVFQRAVPQIPNLAGFIGPTEQCLEIRAYNPKTTALIVATSFYAVSSADLNGFDAHSTPFANIFPELVNDIDNAQSQDASLAAQNKLNVQVVPLCQVRQDCRQPCALAIQKLAMKLRNNVNTGNTRPPLCPVINEDKRSVEKILKIGSSIC